MSTPKHTNDNYKTNGSEKKRGQLSVKNGFPFSSNNPPQGNIYNYNNDKDELGTSLSLRSQGNRVFY